ncbi:MAG: hypothetical protein GY868_04435 [Deltaproteobacteria bacterium]|nr:hypothetical protein [Deltaproteobacteria bacterium]
MIFRIWLAGICFASSCFLSALPAHAANTAVSLQDVAVYDANGSVQAAYARGRTLTGAVTLLYTAPGLTLVNGRISSEEWSERLPPQLSFGLNGEKTHTWQLWVPPYAIGKISLQVNLDFLFRQQLTATALFAVSEQTQDFIGAYACRECHAANHDAWQQTTHNPIPECEACHGPGRAHADADTAEFILTDRSINLCKQCHSLNDGSVIEAANGLIVSGQEYNELQNTAHAPHAACITCHNQHFSTRQHGTQALRKNCRTCHPAQNDSLHDNRLRCEDCHMPRAVLNQIKHGSDVYLSGDTPSHIMRIKPITQPEDMFAANGDFLHQDSFGPYLTLNFACLGCHNGDGAVQLDFSAVRETWRLVH